MPAVQGNDLNWGFVNAILRGDDINLSGFNEITSEKEGAAHALHVLDPRDSFSLLWDGDTGGDVALPAGILTALTDWIDVRDWLHVAWWVYNTGANDVDFEQARFSPTAGGALSSSNGAAAVIAAGNAYMSQEGTMAAGAWGDNYTAFVGFAGLRIYARSALGSSARAYVHAKR